MSSIYDCNMVIVQATVAMVEYYDHSTFYGPVLYKFYDRKFTIVNYASVWSVTYDRNLQS
jgi:hypothetical protein